MQEPAFTGGQPISEFVATAAPGGNTCAGGTTGCTIAGLANGTAYTVTVTAKNAIATSAPSTPSGAVTPQAPISAPAKVKGVKAKVSRKPTSGADSYRVRISKPGAKKYQAWKTTPKRTFKATVKKGKKYRFQITGVGPGGDGPTTTIKFKGK